MIEIIISSIISFVITFFMLPILIQIAATRKLYVVRHFRKIHNQNTSSLGGIAIFTGVLFVMLFFSDFISFKEIRYYIAAGSFIFLVGLRDDFHQIKPFSKLFGQLTAAAIIIFLGGMRIENLTLFSNNIPLSYTISIILSFFIIIWIINAYNFFDGIDLQATLFAIVILTPLGFWLYAAAQYNFSLLTFATASALLAFSFFNFSPSKIFMGDTGTVTIGFIISIGFIKFINLNYLENLQTISIPHPFLFGILLMQLPLVDSLRVSIIRIYRKNSPMVADKNHFHHLLLLLHWKQSKIAIFSASYTLFIFIINLFLFGIRAPLWSIIAINLLFISILYILIYRYLWKKAKIL